MRFYVLLAAVNVASFVPLYVLNLRTAPNPFRHLAIADKTRWSWPLRLVYHRWGSTDPFRVNFDFTLFVLLGAAVGASSVPYQLTATVLLAFGVVEITYTSTMHAIFRRAPALVSDWSLLRSGVALAQSQIFWMAAVAVAAGLLIVLGAGFAVGALVRVAPDGDGVFLPLALAALLLPPGMYRAHRNYDIYIWRAVYSPLLHLGLNLRHSALWRRLRDRDAAEYESFNRFRGVELVAPPNIVLVCVESYGELAYRDPACVAALSPLLAERETELLGAGFRLASTFSEAPLFAGGSWLSYATLSYGTRIDDVNLYDGLFARPSSFENYEGLFHVLRRNGYENHLLCPLGGVDPRSVDWASIDRCFLPHVRLAFDDLDYAGPLVNYLGLIRRHSPLDQYSLGYAYDVAQARSGHFSLFFCTLNSHYPWQADCEATDNWRALNLPGTVASAENRGGLTERYAAAIRYQLDYLTRFARDRATDEPLIVLFGDHQPPFITPEPLGRRTPVHVMSRDERVVASFLNAGFAPSLDPTREDPVAIRHEGFLSLLMGALQDAYGSRTDVVIPFEPQGSDVLDWIRSDQRAGVRAP